MGPRSRGGGQEEDNKLVDLTGERALDPEGLGVSPSLVLDLDFSFVGDDALGLSVANDPLVPLKECVWSLSIKSNISGYPGHVRFVLIHALQ